MEQSERSRTTLATPFNPSDSESCDAANPSNGPRRFIFE